MHIDVLTLFPEMFAGVLGESIVKRALEKGLASVTLTNFRDYATDKHRSVDDKPYGGGPGMVLMCEPMFAAVEDVTSKGPAVDEVVLLTPQGRKYDQKLATELSTKKRLVLIAGHYEGFDERIRTELATMEVSVGDYVLSGGEIPALVLIDSLIRLLPGVLGDDDSSKEESFSHDLLEYPQYTRPAEFRGMTVPEILLSGNHEKIRQWRHEQAVERTERKRPDLNDRHKR